MSETIIIPARQGRAARLAKGQTIAVENPHGTQVVDFWAFNAADVAEHLSMVHCRSAVFRLTPRVGDVLVTNRRRPILTFVEDTSPGIHDTLIACCDAERYVQLGHPGHASCAQNMANALKALGIEPPNPPAPFNLFMNIPIGIDGRLLIAAPVSKHGDRVAFRAEMDVIAVMSACPHDIFPVNGADCIPREAAYAISG
jgi:hypothetical protein